MDHTTALAAAPLDHQLSLLVNAEMYAYFAGAALDEGEGIAVIVRGALRDRVKADRERLGEEVYGRRLAAGQGVIAQRRNKRPA